MSATGELYRVLPQSSISAVLLATNLLLIYRVHKAPIMLLVFSLRVNTTLFIQFSVRSLSEELEFSMLSMVF